MHSLRKWLYKPKKEDPSKLAMFYWADEELTLVATELDSFDGRTDPDRCSILVTQLRICQDKVLSICNDIMDEAIPDARANRDFRIKFPDDVLHENLAGQLWFGAECLAAGSNIVHRELESASMRPLAKALTRSLDNVRCLLREQSLKNSHVYSDKVKEALRIFDRLFAEFELCYVSAMVPIKSAKEYHLQQEIVVLFSETLIRGMKKGLILQDMVDVCDPSLMFTIPRLAIVWGLLIFPEGPFNVDQDPENLSELFRPFFNLLLKIRDLLWTLTKKELATLENMLCSQEEPKNENNSSELKENPLHGLCDFITGYYADHNYKHFVNEFLAFDMFVEKNGNQEDLVDGECQNSKEDAKADTMLRTVYCERDGAESSHGLENGVNSVANHLAVSKSHEMAQNTGRCLITESRSGAYSQNLLTSNDDGRSHFGKVDGQPYIDNCAHPRLENVSFSSEFVHYFPVNAHSSSRSHSIECDLNRYHTDFCRCEDCYNASLPKHQFSLPMRRTNSCIEIIPSSENYSQDSAFESSASNKLSQSFPIQSGYCRSPSSSRSKYPAVSVHCRRRQLLRNRNELVRLASVPSGRLSAGWTQDNLNRMRFISSSYTDTPNSTPIKLVKLKQLHFFRKLNSENQQNHYSSCQSVSTASSVEWNSTSPETSSYNSECHDDEEIALALQAAEIASQNNVRSRFKNSTELLHKLFVCISGVADQLQTNYASDLRNILKCVFDMNCSQSLHSSNSTSSLTQNYSHCNEAFERTNGCDAADDCSEDSNSDTRQEPSLSEEYLSDPQFYEYAQTFEQMDDEGDIRDRCSVDSAEEALPNSSTTLFIVDMEDENSNLSNNYRVPPVWLPDESSTQCMACEVPFTMIRRRHHCRNCGKLFCSRCSSNSIPLPRFGHLKPVRVCNPCFKSPVASLLSHQQT